MWGAFWQWVPYSGSSPLARFVANKKSASRLFKGDASQLETNLGVSRRCTQCAIEMLIERYAHGFRILAHFGFQQSRSDKCLDFRDV